MTASPVARLGLVIRSAPGEGRSNRDQLDVALAAAALDLELVLFFIGDGVLHLVADRDPEAAEWPGGHKGWRSLRELAPVTAWADAARCLELQGAGVKLMLDARPAEPAAMVPAQRACDRLLVL